ncbi:MAG TPA: hypothetical protein VEJ84_20160 [Acidimicrobiales bacterium]|nr:hypothetical protein [Acidimicrobiales bacterium]
MVVPFVAALLLCLSLSLGSGGPAEAAATKSNTVPMVLNCGMGKDLVRPKTLTLACADANNLGKDLVWSKWATTGADASGVDTWNTCVPNCAASKKWDSASADFTLSDAVHTSKGLLFERLSVRITGHTPNGVKRTATYSVAPVAGT